MPGPLPFRLEPGVTWSGMIYADSVREALVLHRGFQPHWRLRAAFWDGTDRTYKAEPKGYRRLFPGRRWLKLTGARPESG
jgi:hypothetical protein